MFPTYTGKMFSVRFSVGFNEKFQLAREPLLVLQNFVNPSYLSCISKVPNKNLPYLPDCPASNSANNAYVHNVECVCSEVRCRTQIRIKALAGKLTYNV